MGELLVILSIPTAITVFSTSLVLVMALAARKELPAPR